MHNLLNVVFGVLITIALTLGGWTLNKVSKQGETLARMDVKMDMVMKDNRQNESQDDQLSKQWKYISKLKTAINELRIKAGDSPIQFE